MKNIFLILFLFSLSLSVANAQENRQKKSERIEAMRVAFITEKLELTVEESQLFWPIFNEYEAERKKIKRSYDRNKDITEMNDVEADAFISQSFEREQRMLDLKKNYFEKFKVAIPVKKIALLSKVERKFRQELIKRMKQRRESRNG